MSTFTKRTGTANPFNEFNEGTDSTPSLADIDGDGDLDAVVGSSSGQLFYYENVGSATAPIFIERTGSSNPFDGIDVGPYVALTLGDLDRDGDLDAVMGNADGDLSYFRNTGSATTPVFTARTGAANPFNRISVDSFSIPTLADLDADGDLDAIIGQGSGTLQYLQNTGSATAPVFTARTGTANPFNGLDVGGDSAPALADLDGDGDLDAVVGETYGLLHYFENIGTARAPIFIERTGTDNPLSGIDAGPFFSLPTLADLDADGDVDIIVGGNDGNLNYFENLANSTNTAPTVVTPISDQSAIEDTPFNFTVPAGTFSDVDAGDTLTYSASLADGSALPAWLSFDASTGRFFGTPPNAAVGTVSVTVTATDTSGETASDTFDIAVVNTNDAPVLLIPLSDQSAIEDAPFGFTVPAGTFGDVDAGDTLTFTATLADGAALPAWLSFDAATRRFNGTPTNDDVGTVSIRLTATDSSGAAISAPPFKLTIANVNDPAEVGGTLTGSLIEDAAPNSVTGTLTVTDIDSPANFQAVTSPTVSSLGYGRFTLTVDGVWTYVLDNANATVNALATDEELQDRFDVLTADGTTQTIAITIIGQSDVVAAPPSDIRWNAAVPANGTLPKAGEVLATLDASDADSSAFTYALLPGSSAGFSLTDGNVTRSTLLGTNATHRLILRATDETGLSHDETVTLRTGSTVGDTLDGSTGDDVFYAAGGDDSVFGDDGDDTLFGGNGNDSLFGGAGDDHLYGGTGGDTFHGGLGSDTLDFGNSGDNLKDHAVYGDLSEGGLGEVIRKFDATGTTAQTDTIDLTSTLRVWLDDNASGTLSFGRSGTSNNSNTAVNLANTEALYLAGTANDGLATSGLTNATALATELNAEFNLTVTEGQRTLLLVNDNTTGSHHSALWLYTESSAGTSVDNPVSAAELTLIGVVEANATLLTGQVALV
ncbi:putative Ig domain-containing protein [Methylolobus aquaticus]